MDLAKIDAGKMDLRCKETNLATFLRGIVAEMSQVAEQKGLSLSLSVQDLSLMALFDPEKIEKVVLNLLFNAIKFTPPAGKIRVVCEREGEQLRISVSDSGVGILPDAQSKIFNRFFQVDGGSTRTHEGTGIGLGEAGRAVS